MIGIRGELFTRYKENPVLTADMWPYTVNAVFNAGVTQLEDKTLLLVRVEDRTGSSHLSVVSSRDGYTDWEIDSKPSFAPEPDSYSEAYGIEDPRITKCADEYMITYTGYSRAGPLVCLAATTDFQTFERRGVIMPPEDKDAALFPIKFGGRWCLIHRPVASGDHIPGSQHVWLSWSPDLKHWGDFQLLLPTRQGWWDGAKVGVGPPPMLTDHGWLLLYHGVRVTAAGSIYRLGLAMVDKEDPTTLIARSREWIFGPVTPYERAGDVPDVVFPCGWILDDDQTVRMYYGAADTSIGVATAELDELVRFAFSHCVCGDSHAIGERCPVLSTRSAKWD
jgi:predicted GH43/DUF377 family glycosyl hydrolase